MSVIKSRLTLYSKLQQVVLQQQPKRERDLVDGLTRDVPICDPWVQYRYKGSTRVVQDNSDEKRHEKETPIRAATGQ